MPQSPGSIETPLVLARRHNLCHQAQRWMWQVFPGGRTEGGPSCGLVRNDCCNGVRLRFNLLCCNAVATITALNSRAPYKALILLVPGERIELPTNGLQNRCSTAELTRLTL